MAIESIIAAASARVAGAIRDAAQSTGASFEYLLTTARIESNLNPAAQATTSSAKGLYQFIEQTWLGTMKQDGPALGLGRYSDAIARTADGHYEVSDPTMRTAIMRLRSDPAVSAMLAGAFTRANASHLSAVIGRKPSEGELYIAHFLGPDGAGKLISAASTQPRANAAAMFPAAAAANPSIFYDRSGHPHSAGQVYGQLTGRFEFARAVTFASGRDTLDAKADTGAIVAAALAPSPTPTPIPTPAPPLPPARTVAPLFVPVAASVAAPAAPPDTAGITQAFAAANDSLPPPPNTRPLFQTMFTDRVRRPLAEVVNSLWAPGRNDTAAARAQMQTLDLFTDIRPNTRKLFGGSS